MRLGALENKMIHVVFRNGKMVQYNKATEICVENGAFALRYGEKKWLVAKIPLDIVERVEFERPCLVKRTKINAKTRQDY